MDMSVALTNMSTGGLEIYPMMISCAPIYFGIGFYIMHAHPVMA